MKKQPGKPRTMEQRLQAAFAYIITGSTEKAGKLVNIPGRTIRDWTYTTWWPDLITQCRATKQEELDGILTGIIHQATDNTIDRLTEGDPFVRKDGSVGFKPVTARDNTMVAAIFTDKRAMIRGEPTTRSAKVSTDSKLAKIRKSLAENDKQDLAESKQEYLQ